MATRKQNGDALLQLLSNMKSDMNRSFDQLHDGQKKVFELLSAHEEKDKDQFDSIRSGMDEAKGAKAQQDANKAEADKKSDRKLTLWMIIVTALAGIPGVDLLVHYLGWVK
jgi:hypothetical protein